jgi:hypothetical protein
MLGISPGISRSIRTTLYGFFLPGPPRLACRSVSRIRFTASRPLLATGDMSQRSLID